MIEFEIELEMSEVIHMKIIWGKLDGNQNIKKQQNSKENTMEQKLKMQNVHNGYF